MRRTAIAALALVVLSGCGGPTAEWPTTSVAPMATEAVTTTVAATTSEAPTTTSGAAAACYAWTVAFIALASEGKPFELDAADALKVLDTGVPPYVDAPPAYIEAALRLEASAAGLRQILMRENALGPPPTPVCGYVLGIGGRDVRVETVVEVVEDLVSRDGSERCLYVGVKGLPIGPARMGDRGSGHPGTARNEP